MSTNRDGVVPLAVALGLLLSGCAEEATVCAADEPVQVLRSVSSMTIDWVAPADGSDLVSIFQPLSSTSPDPTRPDGVFYIKPCAGEATAVAAPGASLFPVQDILPASLSADPTLLCANGGRFVRLDLSGETAPQPALDGLFCNMIEGSHSSLVWIGDDLESASLWLLPAFPARTGGKRILSSVALTVYDAAAPDLLVYMPYDLASETLTGELYIVDLVSGVDTQILAAPTLPSVIDGSGARWIWAPKGPDASMNLYIHERGESVPLGPYSEAVDEPVPYGLPGPRAWLFNETRTHVLHLPWPAGAVMEAFDLEGRPVSLPLTRRPFALTADGGMLAAGDRSDEVLYVRPGDAAPRRLTYPPGVPNNQGTHKGAVIELLWDGQLWDVPLDGAPYRLVARGVGKQFARIDDTHLLTIYQDTLTTIHLPVGVRVEHAKEVDEMSVASAGGYYYTVDPEYGRPARSHHGLWYLPPAAITRPPENCPLVDCANE
jgi:hypothetical protein